MKAERKELAVSDFIFTEVMLAPPPAIRPKITNPDDDPDFEFEDDEEQNVRYPSVDIPLREALRVMRDLLHPKGGLPAETVASTLAP